jgi:midasin (ATPase involved in ribosome maturation)
MKKLQETDSIYKSQTIEIETQDEYDEKSFKELFPDFAEDFDDLIQKDQETGAKQDTKPENEFLNIIYSPKVAYEVLDCFYKAAEISATCRDSWSTIYLKGFDLASEIISNSRATLSYEMDQIGRSGILYAAHARLKSIEEPLNLNSDKSYDFYNDPNVFEAQKAKLLILQFEKKLNVALANWPEHDVLVNLAAICRRIISFPVTSSLMKFLLGLELLMVKSHDWEAYSSKEFSVREELNLIIKQIVEWRKLELESWRDLLDIETRKCAEGVANQWYHLWKLIYRSVDMEIKVNFYLT